MAPEMPAARSPLTQKVGWIVSRSSTTRSLTNACAMALRRSSLPRSISTSNSRRRASMSAAVGGLRSASSAASDSWAWRDPLCQRSDFPVEVTDAGAHTCSRSRLHEAQG